MISDNRGSEPHKAQTTSVFYATNPVGMLNCAETIPQWFSDKVHVLILSAYAYQKVSSSVLAIIAAPDPAPLQTGRSNWYAVPIPQVSLHEASP